MKKLAERRHGRRPLCAAARQKLTLLVGEVGTAAAAVKLGLASTTVWRATAGGHLMPSTIFAIEAGLSRREPGHAA